MGSSASKTPKKGVYSASVATRIEVKDHRTRPVKIASAPPMSSQMSSPLQALTARESTIIQEDCTQNQAESESIEETPRDANIQMNNLHILALFDGDNQILDRLFRNQCGPKLNQLEAEVDALRDRKDRLALAKQKWTNGRLLIQNARSHLGIAVVRWMSLVQVPDDDLKRRYELAAETKNNVSAANENIKRAKEYLNNVKFPYYDVDEMTILHRACANVYIDMQSPDRYKHAMECYSVSYKRCAALHQWFGMVINKSIENDLAKAKAEHHLKNSALRKERLRLMQDWVGEDYQLNIRDEDVSDELEDDFLKNELFADSAGEVKADGQVSAAENEGLSSETSTPLPLPLSELAPPPSQEEIFGNIEKIKREHTQVMAHIERAQETNKARVEQDLQEKLRQRKSMRSRGGVGLEDVE